MGHLRLAPTGPPLGCELLTGQVFASEMRFLLDKLNTPPVLREVEVVSILKTRGTDNSGKLLAPFGEVATQTSATARILGNQPGS